MRVKEKELLAALQRYPTRNWSSTLRYALSEIKEGTIARYNGVLVVDDSVWNRAMKDVSALPAGGRWVAAERKEMYMWLGRALNFNQGEK
jgi:hypothetical protein